MAKNVKSVVSKGLAVGQDEDLLAWVKDPVNLGASEKVDAFNFENLPDLQALPTGKQPSASVSEWLDARPSSRASEWAQSLNVSAAPSAPGEQQDVMFLNPAEWSAFGAAKTNSGGGGSGGKTTTSTIAPYTTGRDDGIADSAQYNITIEFKGSYWTDSLLASFKAAANLLAQYITGDLQDVSYRGKVIDDIVISAEFKPIDGSGNVLGQAGPTALRTGSYLPCAAKMEFDSDDMGYFTVDGTSAGQVSDFGYHVILHEMMHSLGFGTIWSYKNLVQENTTTDATNDYWFVGTQAQIAYGGAYVPVEGDYGSGTKLSHWDEEDLTNELMTGIIKDDSNHLDAWTWASLRDLGYTVPTLPASFVPVAPEFIA